jgi:hypothetical protein
MLGARRTRSETADHVAHRTREIDDRIEQIHRRGGRGGGLADDAIDAAEHAAVSLARALIAYDRCALQHERTARTHNATG